MVVQTWGFVKTRPNYPWTNVELRAESGAVFRVSGATYSDALACLARVRSALQGMEVAWPGKALTLHVHPHCSQEDMMHLDLAVAPNGVSSSSHELTSCSVLAEQALLVL